MPAEVFRSNETFGQEKAEFDCGKFTMTFSDQPGGFEVTTDKSLPRRTGMDPIPLTKDQGQILRTAMRNQFDYTAADKAKVALDAYRKNGTEANKKAFEAAQQLYYDNKSIVTSVQNMRRDKNNPNNLIVDIRPVNLPFASNFSKPEASFALAEMASSFASTTMILETSDNMGIMQIRRPDQGWPLSPAASASGYIDEIPFEKEEIPKQFMDEGVKTKHLTRKLKKLTTKDVKDNALRELYEEIGLPPSDVFDFRIGAMVHEKQNVHDEFIASGKTKLTAAQVIEKSAQSAKSIKLRPGEHREKFLMFDLNPDNIETLLTKVKAPLPRGHASAYINKGYELMLKKGSKEQAVAWRKKVGEGLNKNYDDIDKLVAKHHATMMKVVDQQMEKFVKDKPDATTQEIEYERILLTTPSRQLTLVEDRVGKFKTANPSATKDQLDAERKRQILALPKRNPNGYSTGFAPEEQGLEETIKAFDTARFKYKLTKQS